jgi:hypothetical protein
MNELTGPVYLLKLRKSLDGADRLAAKSGMAYNGSHREVEIAPKAHSRSTIVMFYRYDPAVMDEKRAQAVLDIHFSVTMGCTVSDLRRPGWTIVSSSEESDPGALLFGRRTLLSLLRPGAREPAAPPPGGVARVAANLRVPVAALLAVYAPPALFTAEGEQALGQLIGSLSSGAASTPDEAHFCVSYATGDGYRPYSGQWQEWIEPLDEFGENEPLALRLLAQYSGGVYVVRIDGTIAGYAGIRIHSPRVAEVLVHTLDPNADLAGQGLSRAVASRATKAIFAGGRVPIYQYAGGDSAAASVASSLGYHFYADAVTYTTEL